jgi:hypothetical protein
MHHSLRHRRKRTLILGLVFLLFDGGLVIFSQPETTFIILVFLFLLFVGLIYVISFATQTLWRGIVYSMLVVSLLVIRLIHFNNIIPLISSVLFFAGVESYLYKKRNAPQMTPPASS